jgi:hypothetical protein
MKALIQNNKVVQLSENTFEVHEDLSWIDVGSSVQVGWVLENGIPTNPDKRTDAEKAEFELVRLRARRDRKLAETDWWALPDTGTMTQAQMDYRQALRDITETYSSLAEVVWPSMPT